MSTALLDPEPFRKWYAEKKEHLEVEEIAKLLGVDPRTLRRWDLESERIRRGELEDALLRSPWSLWDIYPEFGEAQGEDLLTHGYCTRCREEVPVDAERGCMWCGKQAWRSRSGVRPGTGTKLTDAQLRHLHTLYEQGATLAELGRRVWRHAGYRNAESGKEGIRHGWKRLHLPTSGQRAAVHRRCSGVKARGPRKGKRCTKHTMFGSDYCREHDPARRQEVLAQAERALMASTSTERNQAERTNAQ
jgi:hypothetical protein